MPPFKVPIEGSQISIKILDFHNSRFSRKWTECIDKEWLEELERKEKIGKRLEQDNRVSLVLIQSP